MAADYDREDYGYDAVGASSRVHSATDRDDLLDSNMASFGKGGGRGSGSVVNDGSEGMDVIASGEENDETESDSIKVLVRIRPFIQTEGGIGKTDSNIDVISDTSMSVRSADNKKSFQCSFDSILDMHCSQDDLYNYVRKGTLSVLEGFNSTIFAYGQTGSGKTYSMYGPSNESNQSRTTVQDVRQLGVIPRAINEIFSHIEKCKTNKGDNSKILDCTVYCSFLQIYNENLYDMLRDVSLSQPLTIREDAASKDIYVQGLSEYQVKSVQDTLQLLRFAEENRFVRETQMNQFSSRSHSIFQIWLEQKRISDVDGGEVVLKSKFNLVDLAGSEKWNINQYMAENHITEMTNINLSLHTLGRCIAGLAQRSLGKDGHIPYRESKLTRLLQDSLGGNAKTFLIATVSPAKLNFEETISTLKFADRAKQVMVTAVINEHRPIDHAMVLRLQKEVEYLRNLVKQLQIGGISAVVKPELSVNIPRKNSFNEDSGVGVGGGQGSAMFVTEGSLLSPTSLARLGNLGGGIGLNNNNNNNAHFGGGRNSSSALANLSQSQNFDFLGSLQSALTVEREAAIQLNKENQALKNELRLQQEKFDIESQNTRSTIQPYQIKNVIDTVQVHHVKIWSNVDVIQKLMKKFSKFEIEEEEMTGGIMKAIASFGEVRNDTTIFDRLNALMPLTHASSTSTSSSGSSRAADGSDNYGLSAVNNPRMSPSRSLPAFMQQSGSGGVGAALQKNVPVFLNSSNNNQVAKGNSSGNSNSNNHNRNKGKSPSNNNNNLGDNNNISNSATNSADDGLGLVSSSSSNSLFFAREDRLTKQQEKYLQNLQQQLSIQTPQEYSIGKEFKADLIGPPTNEHLTINNYSNNNNNSSNNSNNNGGNYSANSQGNVKQPKNGRQNVDRRSNDASSSSLTSSSSNTQFTAGQSQNRGHLSPRPPPNYNPNPNPSQQQQSGGGLSSNHRNNSNNGLNNYDSMEALDASLSGLQNIQQNIQSMNPKSSAMMPAVAYRVRGAPTSNGATPGNGSSGGNRVGQNHSNNNSNNHHQGGENNNGNVVVSGDGWVSMKDDGETDEEKLKKEMKKQQAKLKKQQQMQEWLQSKEERMSEAKRAEDEERQFMLEAEQNKELKRQEYAKKAKKKISDYQQKIKEEAEQIQHLVDLGIDPNSLF